MIRRRTGIQPFPRFDWGFGTARTTVKSTLSRKRCADNPASKSPHSPQAHRVRLNRRAFRHLSLSIFDVFRSVFDAIIYTGEESFDNVMHAVEAVASDNREGDLDDISGHLIDGVRDTFQDAGTEAMKVIV